MATFNMLPPTGVTTNKAGPGPGQGSKAVIRQFTLTGALAISDVLVGPAMQRGAIIYRVTRIGGPAGNLGTTSAPTAFNTAPFTPYVVPNGENVQYVATAAGGTAGDVITLLIEHVPLNT